MGPEKSVCQRNRTPTGRAGGTMYASLIRRCAMIALLVLASGCATQAPQQQRLGLKLAPAALGASIARQQHLKVEREGRIDDLDAALEVDADSLELVGIAFGQRVLSLSYDGKELK